MNRKKAAVIGTALVAAAVAGVAAAKIIRDRVDKDKIPTPEQVVTDELYDKYHERFHVIMCTRNNTLNRFELKVAPVDSPNAPFDATLSYDDMSVTDNYQ